MTIQQAQEIAKRFMKRTGFLVSWIEIRAAIKGDNVIIREGIKFIALQKIKL